MRPEAKPAAPARDRSLRVGAVVALALAVAFVVWLLVRGNDSGSSKPAAAPPATSTNAAAARTRPLLRAVSVASLKGFAAGLGHPVYWAGAEEGITYELTRTVDG